MGLAQSGLPSYWQHTTSGRLDQLLLADIDGDGADEFLVADENGRVDAVNAAGLRLWSYQAPEPAHVLAAFNVDGPDQPQLEILVGVPNRLVLLEFNGQERWRSTLTPLEVPSAVLTAGGQELAEEWLGDYTFMPAAIAAYDQQGDGVHEILVLLRSGELLLYDATGKIVWRQGQFGSNPVDIMPHLLVSDFDQDGRDEIVLAVFNQRRFGQLIYLDDEEVRWDVPLSGRITDLVGIRFDPVGQPLIAAGTSLGQVQVYDHQRQQRWFRTLNQPVTALSIVNLPEGMALAAGTDVGTVITYNGAGHRVWTSGLAENADRRVLSISGNPVAYTADQPVMAVMLAAPESAPGAADVILLDASGDVFSNLVKADTLGLTQMADINRDQKAEVAIARFATLELLGLGLGNSENLKEWEYALNAAPTAILLTDLDGDRQEELVIGTQDGRIHSLGSDRSIRWLHDTGGTIDYLAPLPPPTNDQNHVLVIGHDTTADNEVTGWIELREAKGEKIWEQPVGPTVASLLVEDTDNQGFPEIVLGTVDGRVLIFASNGQKTQDIILSEQGDEIRFLQFLPDSRARTRQIIAATPHKLVAFDLDAAIQPQHQLRSFDSEIVGLFSVPETQKGHLTVRLLVLTTDGKLHGLNQNGIEMAHWSWPVSLGSTPSAAVAAASPVGPLLEQGATSLLIGTKNGGLQRVDVVGNRPQTAWRLENLGALSVVNWVDQNGDGLADMVASGSAAGEARLFTQPQGNEPQLAFEPLELSSAVFALHGLRRQASPATDLLAVTENGLVQLFREQENRPPLLTSATAGVEQGQYRIGVAVNDVEGDEITVRLDIFDTQTREWLPQQSQTVTTGLGQLFWPLSAPPASPDGLLYRFTYTDGFYEGSLLPPAGPPTLPASALDRASPYVFVAVATVGLGATLLFIRQAQSTAARANRFYRRLRHDPRQSLLMLEKHYVQFHLYPDLLLHLANQARQAGDQLTAELADGLFLLKDQPHSGLTIISRALDRVDTAPDALPWHGLPRWQATMRSTKTLLDAPSVTELSLLRPPFLELLELLRPTPDWFAIYDRLRPVLTNLRDCERVDLIDDRIVYLNEASTRLRQLRQDLFGYDPSLERTLVAAIVRRWTGIVSAKIEELRGRADLVFTLRTRRVISSGETPVVLDVHNRGRSAAENVVLALNHDAAYQVLSPPQEIPFLPPGRTQEARFNIDPLVVDRFRVSVSITYDDRHRRNKESAFGDMLYLLPPAREFAPIPNPYTPGTPLRPDSMLFYGREDLFEFIAENGGYRAFRNVLILVGQRRTGKTSVLLRLEDHLPRHLYPVYIDCQSLGVIPGMPALLEELALTIADTLARRDLNVTVPHLAEWQKDPTHLFQRRFLPAVKALLPADATLLLVFDEFEAFENLVADGILPPTFFTYLRHLMQHGEQLNFVFVGSRRLEEMTADYWSVLFNIALYRKIDFLSNEAAIRLITEPVAAHLVYDDLALDKILRVTAGHPYFLQLVCYTLVKRANARRSAYVTISDVNAAVDEMLRLGEVHFAYLWQRSTPPERTVLTAVAHLLDSGVPFRSDELLRQLELYDIHLAHQDLAEALSSLVERDILREVTEQATTLFELRLGLVGSWVLQNKSLSKLYAHGQANGNGDGHQPIRVSAS